MKNINALAAIMWIVLSCHAAFALNVGGFCTSHQRLTDAAFLEGFPFADYLARNMADPLQSMIDNRATLKAQGRGAIVDAICFETSEYFLKSNPIDVTRLDLLQLQLVTAEDFLQLNVPNDSALTGMAHQIGDRFLGAAAYRIEEGYKTGALDKKSPDFEPVLEILRRNQYNPNIGASSAEKLWSHAQKGDWAYIWDRFKTRYLKDTILAISLGLNLLLLLRPVVRRLRRR